MEKRVKILVPELLKERGVPPINLVRYAGLSIGTAYKMANPKTVTTNFNFDVLMKLCDYFNVPASEILRYDPNEVDSG
jgi:DNA-binding Xre family transcriptional regulator